MRSRNQMVQFTQAFPPDAGTADYESDPWTRYSTTDLEEKERLFLLDTGCDLFDLFRPLRDPRFVTNELADSRTTVYSSGILDDLTCFICKGVCKETTVVKECFHRFCGQCIQRYIREGQSLCPECGTKISSRRALRQDEAFDGLIERLFPDLNKFETSRKAKPPPLLPAKDQKEPTYNRISTSSADDDSDDALVEDSKSSSSESLSDSQQSSSVGSSANQVRRNAKAKSNARRSAMKSNTPCFRPIQQPPRWAQEETELSSDEGAGPGSFEVFLVCLNHNLPPAVCSMARELSKRPMRFPAETTTQTVGYFLAGKLVRDVLGPCDPASIVADLSFVREREVWPAMSNIPISEVCRAVTESRGPIALRYLLSDHLFALCERIEHYAGSTSSTTAAPTY